MAVRDDRTEDQRNVCSAKHKPLYWGIGLLTVLVTALIAMVLNSITTSRAASDEAFQAAKSSEAISIRTSEYREYVKNDMNDLKTRQGRIEVKLDEVNNNVQRLIQKSETK